MEAAFFSPHSGLATYATCDDVGDIYFPALPDVLASHTCPDTDTVTDQEIVLSALALANSEKHSLHANHSPVVRVHTHSSNPVIVVNGYDSQSCSSTQDSHSHKSQDSVVQVTVDEQASHAGGLNNGTGGKAASDIQLSTAHAAQIEPSDALPNNLSSPSKKTSSSKSPSKKSKASKQAEKEEKFQFDNPAYSQSFQEISKNASNAGTIVWYHCLPRLLTLSHTQVTATGFCIFRSMRVMVF